MSRSRLVNLENFTEFTAINVLSDPGYDKADQVIPNCIEVRLNWTLSDGKLGHNVLHGQVPAGFTPTAPIAQALFAGLSSGAPFTSLLPAFAAATHFAGVSLRDLRTKDQPYIDSTGAAVPGTSVLLALPNEVAIVITKRTALVGRQNRGRAYMMGFGTDNVAADNTIVPGLVTALNVWAATWTNVFTGQGMTHCLGLKHRLAYTSAAGKPIPERLATTVPITQVVVRDNHWDSQRRRGLK